MSNDIRQQVEALLDLEIRPALAAHDGNIMIQSIDEGTINVKLSGRCSTCPSALTVTGNFIREKILNAFPQFQTVVFNCVSEEFTAAGSGHVESSKG